MAEDTINVSGFPVSEKRQKITWVLSYAFLLLPIFYLFQWSDLLGLYGVLAIILGYGYSKKIKIKNNEYRLKNIIFVKNATSAACWGAFATFVPVFYYNTPLSLSLFAIWLNFFVFVLAVEIVWDIRDIAGDRAAGIRTIPNTFGVLIAKLICLLPIVTLFGWRLTEVHIHPIYIVAYILTILSIIFVRKKSHPYTFQNLVTIWIIANTLFLIQYYVYK